MALDCGGRGEGGGGPPSSVTLTFYFRPNSTEFIYNLEIRGSRCEGQTVVLPGHHVCFKI